MAMDRRIIIAAAVVAAVAVLGIVLLMGSPSGTAGGGTANGGSNGSNVIVGGDRDAHGCIGSAGYSWCEAKQKCLRAWEEPCSNATNNPPIVGGDRDAHGCIGSAGYSWCEAKQKCVREWEEPCGPTDCLGMSFSDAMAIAGEQCGDNATMNRICNEGTKTWWIDMDIVRPGCSPACVVNVETRTAEINWRCTGLLPQI